MANMWGDFFPVLGLRPLIGRLIGPEDDHIGSAGAAAAVVSWSFWKNRFNLDPGILGKRIFVDKVPLTVVGVTPRAFSGLQVGLKSDIWMPVAVEPMIGRPSRVTSGHMSLALMGRLKPGVSIEQARAEMSMLDQGRIAEISKAMKDPLWRQAKMDLEPAGAGFSRLRDQFAKPLLVLMVVVACCYSSRASMWQVCCWRAERPGSAKWQCAFRWPPAGFAWCARC